ncbi:MAG: Gfo/Idh/MocA family oxidoreductase, partial [Flavobacteriales bacterium]|nr:Gfo/Idh/MocA family oxidoreductase [Flavobacteriales bacterium]
VYNRNTPGIEDLIMKFSNGSGVDSVIITAGTSSLDPVELAGAVARKKAKVVIVGAVPTGFNRANYYKKELDLRMSMSYGPGRQDPTYEDKGIDYPIGYVRWTENRNMQSYLELIAAGKLDISGLISHTFKLEEAPEAYNMILSRSEAFNGVVIQYEEGVPSSRLDLASKSFPASEPNVGMIGAGNFAQGTLLPNMKDHCNFVGVATGRGNMSKYVGEKYKFNYCAESASEVFEDKNVNTIVITTRHDSHAEYVIKGIEAGKHVFVEKPLAMNEEELESIREAYNSTAKENPVQVMVGFNRRFAPPVQEVKKLFVDEQPKSIMMRINAGVVPPDHWVNDPKVGGGRIIGEGCHFIDLAMYLAGNKITAVSASAMQDANGLNNTVVVNLEFANGSVASVSYFSNGSKSVAKEYIEVFCGQTVAIIDDFRSLTISGSKNAVKKFKQDKGHAEELKQFFGAIKAGRPQPISFEDCYVSSLATLKVLESIRENRKILL